MAKHPRRPLRTLVILLALFAALAVFVRWDNTSLCSELFTDSSSRLPAGFDGFRIAVLSDLHGAEFGEGNAELFSAVSELRPDLIAFTGDLVDHYRGIDWDAVNRAAAGLAAIAPVYYVTGNHEWAAGDVPALKELLSAAGWTVLSNRFVTLERNGDTIALAGIDDPNGYADQKTPEALAAELRDALGDPYWLLLAHRNDRFEKQYSLLGADLTLSGHGHGGMIRLPFTDGLIGTQRNLFPSYTAGFYTAGGQTVFVSRGLGNSGSSFRLFNRPQAALVILRRG